MDAVKIALLILITLLLIVGCMRFTPKSLPYAGRPPKGIIDWSDESEASPMPGIEEAKIIYFGDNVVLWTDYPAADVAASVAYSSVSNQVGCGGQLIHKEYGLLEFLCRFETETTGNVTIADQTYDLAKGSLFLVSVRSPEKRIEQVTCDLQAVEKTEAGMKSLIETEPAIRKFFEAKPQ